MSISDKDFGRANARAERKRAQHPTAAHVCFDRHIGRIVVTFDSGIGITIPHRSVRGLKDATPAQLEDAQISPSGLGIHFPQLDADVYLPALLDDFLGASRWTAMRNGKAGGKVTTEVKATAARANGRLGGRPRKHGASATVARVAIVGDEDVAQASVNPADKL